MTPASYLRGFKSPDCNNHQASSCSPNSPQYQPDAVVAGGTSAQTEPRHTVLHGPLACYQASLDTNSPPEIGINKIAREDDGYTCQTGVIETQTFGNQHQTRARTNLAVRLANRSNGAPLATIIEQGSYSTLNTHGSRLSVGRFPSLRAAENTSPNRATNRRSQSLDEKALHRIQEYDFLEQGAIVVAETHVVPSADQEHGTLHSGRGTDAPAKSDPVKHQQTPGSSTPVKGHDCSVGSRWINKVFHKEVQNVRVAPRTRSRSSSTAHVSMIDSRQDWSDTITVRPQFQNQDTSSETLSANDYVFDTPNYAQSSCSSAASKQVLDSRTRNRKISMANPELSAHVHSLSVQIPSESDIKCGSVRPLPPYSHAARSRERCLPAGVMFPEPRDVAQENGTIKVATPPNHNKVYASAQYTLDNFPVLRNNTSSLIEDDRARYASRNVSFCSTMSTSYSGTVLGVDLDLQHDSAHQSRRSRSVTPVWFTPQMAELERRASSSESPEWRQTAATETTSRSITSSALTSLLPIAAASGIVRLNYNTPKLSFYSPSGNLIQPENDSTLGAMPSEYGGSSITTSYYRKANPPSAQNVLPATVGLPPARPSLLPVTTLPTFTAQLPAHLRHHKNSHHAELSQISPCEPFLALTPAVKGCGGVVRSSSFSPRSGHAQPHNTQYESKALLKHCRSTRSIIRSVKSEANFYASRFVNQILSSSCTPPLPSLLTRSKLRGKRNATKQGMYAIEPHFHSRIVVAHARSSRRANEDVLEGMCGSSTAHMLRVCFCQPYDEAGKRSLCRDTEAKANGDGDVELNVRIARKQGRRMARAT